MNDPDNLTKAAQSLREHGLVDIATRKPEIAQVIADWMDDASRWEPAPGSVNHDMRAYDVADLILAEDVDE